MSPMNNRLMRPRASGGFSPKNISNLAAWYDISSTTDSSKVTTVAGAISALIDLSGNGKNAIQNTANNRPAAVSAAFNGLDVARFSNVSPVDFLTASGLTFCSTNFTVLFAIAPTSSVSAHCFLAEGSSAGLDRCGGIVTNAGFFARMCTGIGYGTAVLARLANQMQILTVTGDPVSGESWPASTFRRNKGTTGTSDIGGGYRAQARDRVFIGAGQAGIDSPYVGDIGEIVIYQRKLVTSEIESVEQYLAKKWGVTLT